MGWAERVNPNSERNLDQATRERRRRENEEAKKEGTVEPAGPPRGPLYAYGRAVLRSAKARRRQEKIEAAAMKLKASIAAAQEQEAEAGSRKILIVDDGVDPEVREALRAIPDPEEDGGAT